MAGKRRASASAGSADSRTTDVGAAVPGDADTRTGGGQATGAAKGFRPELGFWSLTFLIVGSMIGSGIFFKPGSMLAYTGSVPLVMLAWIGGAVVALSGGLMFAELGAAIPKAGGQYVFLRDGLGKLPSFLFSWTGFTVVQSGTMAAVAVALAQAFDTFVGAAFHARLPGDGVGLATRCMGDYNPVGDTCVGFALPPWGQGLVALLVIVGLTVINYFGVKRGAAVNNIATIAKVAALAIIILLVIPVKDAGNFSGGGSIATDAGKGGALGFGLALSASLFAYDGFAQATFVAGEVKDARRTVPRAIIAAGVGVAVIYLLATFAYFHVLPAAEVSSDALHGVAPIATQAMTHVFSNPAVADAVVATVAAAIVVSTFGTVNAYVLASPRIYHPIAQDREFPGAFGVLSRHRTPTYGLWFGAVWAGLLTLSGGFDTLADLTVFGLYVFYFLTVVAYFMLRRRQPQAFQGFRVPGSPLPAIVFGLGAIYVLQSYLQKDIPALAAMRSPLDILTNTSLFGILLIGSGLVAYIFVRRNARREAMA